MATATSPMIRPSCHCPTTSLLLSASQHHLNPDLYCLARIPRSSSPLSPRDSESFFSSSSKNETATMATYTSDQPPTTDPQSETTTAKQSIPSHPAPTDAAVVSSGVPTDASTSTGGDNNRKKSSAEKHAIEHAEAWKPNLDRRQSWSKEDQKRALQMSGIKDE